MAGYKRNYIQLAESLLKRGTVYQKKCIAHLKEKYTGEQQRIEIEEFVKNEISLNRVRL